MKDIFNKEILSLEELQNKVIAIFDIGIKNNENFEIISKIGKYFGYNENDNKFHYNNSQFKKDINKIEINNINEVFINEEIYEKIRKLHYSILKWVWDFINTEIEKNQIERWSQFWPYMKKNYVIKYKIYQFTRAILNTNDHGFEIINIGGPFNILNDMDCPFYFDFAIHSPMALNNYP